MVGGSVDSGLSFQKIQTTDGQNVNIKLDVVQLCETIIVNIIAIVNIITSVVIVIIVIVLIVISAIIIVLIVVIGVIIIVVIVIVVIVIVLIAVIVIVIVMIANPCPISDNLAINQSKFITFTGVNIPKKLR